jgi:hypothetical protein
MSLERTTQCAMIPSFSTQTTSSQASHSFVCLCAVREISRRQGSASTSPKKIGWMVNNDYTDMEDVAVNEEAIEFDNRNDNNQENGDDDDCNNDDNDDDNNEVLYSKVTATKKRKKGTRSKPMMSKKRKP